MNSTARAYLLGSLSEADRERLEAEYFASADAIDPVAAEEELLIESYLDGTLEKRQRQQFEQHYLASLEHRRRVEIVRRLGRAARPRVRHDASRWLAAAAALLFVVGGAWLLRPQRAVPPAAPPVAIARPAPSAPQPPTATPPRVFAFALSPVSVRSAQASPTLVVPAGTDLVVLELQRDGTAPPLRDRAAVVRTVGGRDVWRGVATASSKPGVLAKLEVPASQLPPEDYFVDAGGYGYFLRVRARER